MRWEVLIEILLHITPDINTDTGWQAGHWNFISPLNKIVSRDWGLVMNECDNMRALLATWASSLLTGLVWSAGLVTRPGHRLSNSILMDFLCPTITSYKPGFTC